MPDPTILRSGTRRFDPTKARIDRARQVELLRTRNLRAAGLLGRRTPYDLKPSWLTLRPDRPFAAGKGWLEYTSPSKVGVGNFEDGDYMFAAFDLIFEKDTPGGYSIERPAVTIQLMTPPSAIMLVEMDIHAHDWPPGDPRFEINAAAHQFIDIPDGHRDTVMFLMHDYASIQSAWAEGADFTNRDGGWGFFEARITPID
ncbi:hypothetical protein [Brevundimonas sp.]|uniref:hypothetical protein n=1 Tax=Brevundimonas sp. TaxID=1871086 RepID=UPI0037C0F917